MPRPTEDLDKLLAVVAYVEAIEAALRALVGQENAGMIEVASYLHCAYCGAMHEAYTPHPPKHRSGCPIVVARKALGGE